MKEVLSGNLEGNKIYTHTKIKLNDCESTLETQKISLVSLSLPLYLSIHTLTDSLRDER